MATLTLIKVDIVNPSSTCPNTVPTSFRFLGGWVGAAPPYNVPKVYNIPKGPTFTFPNGGAKISGWNTGGKLEVHSGWRSIGNALISPNPGPVKTYVNFTPYGKFVTTYKVT